MSETQGTLRRDAERSRERVVQAARELFAERGLGVGFNEVAHRAGVGVGTVYRRFADKDELVRAALAEPMAEMLEVTRRATEAEHAWDGLELLVERISRLLVENLGLRDAALGGGAWELGRRLAEDVSRVLCELLDRARTEGELRPGVEAEDVLLVLWLVTDLAEHAADVHPTLYRRYLQVLLDGLRTGPGRAPLPAAATREQVELVSRAWAGNRRPAG